MAITIGKQVMKFRTSFLAVGLAGALIAALPAEAKRQCPSRTSMTFGETAEALAHRCGITVEALERQNPGFDRDKPQVGVGINVPPPPLPSPQIRVYGNRGIIAPPPQIYVPRL
jgi:hypothetical protein